MDAQNFWSLIQSNVQWFTEPLRTEFQNLPLKLCFLSAILEFTGKSQIENDNLQALLDRASSVLAKVRLEYLQLVSNFYGIQSMRCWVMPIEMDGQVSRMVEGLELLVPDILEIYTLLSKSPRKSIVYLTDEAVMKNLNFILKNMEDLLMCKGDCVASVKEEVEAVQKSLSFLRDFVGFNAKSCRKLHELKNLLFLAEFVVGNISCLLFLCLIESKMDGQILSQMKVELSKHLQKLDPVQLDARKIYIKALMASKSGGNPTPLDGFSLNILKSLTDNLLELSLSDSNLSFMTSIRGVLLDLHRQLSFLKDFILDVPWKQYSTEVDQRFKDLWGHSDSLIKEAGCVIYSLYDEENESLARELHSATLDMLAKIEVAKEDARNIYNRVFPKSLRSNFPKTDKIGYISFIFQYLKGVVISQADSVTPLKYHIKAVLKDLEFLWKDFSGVVEQHIEPEELDLLTRFKDLLYHSENMVDLSLFGGHNIWALKLGLFDVIEEVKIIKQELKHIRRMKTNEASGNEVSFYPVEISPGIASSKDDDASSPRSNNMRYKKKANSELSIFRQEEDKIKEQITSESKKLEILSIVGMPGVGKTTLGNSVFQHFCRTNCFHVLAKCTVTQRYRRKQLFLELLEDITPDTKEWCGLNDEDLAQMLYKILKGRKYLLFMDDIWNFRPLQDMKASLPDDENGSRILLTSRFDNIASQSNCVNTIHGLSPILDEEAWELLQLKLFGNENCPEELAEIGKEMAKICRGLPLLVDVIAGLLREAEAKRNNWQQVAQRLKAQPVDDLEGRCSKVIELSYSDLPDHLKACFLYFSGFPKGEEISKNKLISMWIAEGFVRILKDDPRGLEVAAESYLDDLIARNLVTTKGGSLGKVKASRIHDVLHDFALAKARDENFLLRIQKYNSDLPTLSFNNSPTEGYRLCCYPNEDEKDNFLMAVNGARVRTLLFNWLPFSLCDICYNFRLLRLLDMDVLIKNFDPITTLIHLRFLALHSLEARHLPEIHKLQRLESFLLQRAYINEDNRVLLLEHICGMIKLRHFRLNDSYIWDYNSGEVFDNLQLENLLSLSHPKLCYGTLSEMVMERMPNLRKLTCTFLDSWDSARNCNLFPKLELLRKLESLKVTYNGSLADGSYPCKFSFPPYLKKVSLELFCRPWSEISVLGKLEHLEVLKLGRQSFEGETWDVIDGEFPKLKCMFLDDLDVRHWIASEDHLPCLEVLSVIDCKQLEELPSCLAEKETLKSILVYDCQASVGLSANKIKEDQTDNGNEQLIVLIYEGITDELILL